MSSICHGFVQNAWRKDICSNCFRIRDEHSTETSLRTPYSPSVHCQGNGVNGSGQSETISDSSDLHHSHNPTTAMNNHHISILVKNSDPSVMSQKSPTGRYQSPTSGIPRANSHLKYGSNNPKSAYYSTFSADSFKAGKQHLNGHMNGSSSNGHINGNSSNGHMNGSNSNGNTTANSSEVNGISNKSSSNGIGGSKKPALLPFRGDKDGHVITGSRIVNNSLHGSAPSPTVVSVSGDGLSGCNNSSSSPSHYNNNHSSNANNSSHNGSAADSPSKRSGVVSGGGGEGKTQSSQSSGTIVSVVTNTSKNHSEQSYHKTSQSANFNNSKASESKGFVPNGDGGNKPLKNSSEGVKTIKFDTMDKSAKYGDSADGDISTSHKIRNKVYKGILKALDGKKRRKLSVKFNKEVCEVIGYSGDSSGEQSEDEDDEDMDDPQDLVSISELLATNSTTPAEKELHQQTIKNTNFNSIKTNLLGYAPIEIGPIVGCTGGKSMENSSKPLVSIGTFESRKEPLRIRKINDVDVEVKNEIKEKQTPVVGKVAKETKLSGILKKSNSSTNGFLDIKDPAASSPTSKSQRVSTSTAKTDNLVVNVSVNTANVKVTPAKSLTIGGMSEVKINGKDVVRSDDGVSTIEVNPEKSSIKITTDIPVKSSASIHPTINSVQVDRATPSPAIISNQRAATDNGQTLKSANSSDSSPIPNIDNPINNLIILNGGNIASKRTSFLKEIISNEPVTVVSSQTSTLSSNHTVEEPMSLCLEKDSLDATVLNAHNLKADLNLKLNHLRSYDILEDNSEFDDSLEDSGLDIKSKTTVENSSESDDNDIEKFGSSSDSGNENDFNERIEVPQPGLYISVDDEDVKNNENSTKPKLSPDSVLFSSASEMSNSGSSESIPECINVHVIGANVKRQAPLPPATAPPTARLSQVYSNQEEDEEDQNDIYDDVTVYQQERQLRLEQEQEQQEQEQLELPEEPEEESLYDDCVAISSNNNGKFVTGSYDFTNGTRTVLDTDSGADIVDRIPLRPSDGIEFIGIRKIDSETHLNATLEGKQRSPSPEGSKKERSSSVSPKARRRVNHFFSTLGKKAGAAFSSSHSPLSGTAGFMRNKSPSPAPIATVTEYKRSLSQDEVSMARTQEIYATLTPASLKFKGLAPVLQKLSRMENESKEDSPKEKMFKKHKIIPSIKKLFRSGGKDKDNNGEFNVRSYDFKTELKASPSNGDTSSNAASSESSSNPPSLDDSSFDRNRTISSGMTASKYRPGPPTTRPPPPPPRVHSLDLLNRVGTVGPNSTIGSVKPARPPPPVRSNRIAPSFVSVFATQDDGMFNNETGPPSKPKRKASMNGHGTISHMRHDGEMSLDNNVSSLNFETLRLIAGQIPAKIKTKSSHFVKFSSSPIRWSHFYLSDFEPMADGDSFAFYSALWENVPCVLLIQEDLNCSAFGNLSCVEVAATFVDTVPIDLVPWNPADYSNGRHEVKVNVSVLPSCTIMKISAYINSRSFSSMQKYFALLQALNYWGKEDMSDLLVFQGGSKDQETPADSELVYVVPVDSHRTLQRSYSHLSNNFEIQIKQYLLQPHVLSGEDRQVLYRLISGTPQEVEFQLKLFLQVKLFASRMKSEEMEKLRRTKSERVVSQWIERERALCMKEAIERTIQRDNEHISPLKKAFVEFLMIPDISAKALLDLIVDLSNY